VTAVNGEFRESTAQPRVESVGLSHVSVEVGHLYMEDIKAGPAALRATFQEIAPWVRVATESPTTVRGGTIRASTCFLVDDYFAAFSTPATVVPEVLAAAEDAGVTIDYLARESACAVAGDSRPVDLALGRLVIEPTRGTTGARPPATQSGWLCNGERSPGSPTAEAMTETRQWQPPVQAAARRHSIFVDVELWNDESGSRLWSCPMLAAVWQLLRLGLLRDDGRPVAVPRNWTGSWPDRWEDLAPVTRLQPAAYPFAAYTTMSIVSPRFLPVELAVRTILSQLSCEAAVLEQVTDRARQDKLDLPGEIVDRLHYVFVGSSGTDPA